MEEDHPAEPVALQDGPAPPGGRVHLVVSLPGPLDAWLPVPHAIPGVAFLSGGQSAELATARLNAMHVSYPKTPWTVTFSYSRATQQPALDLWKGKDENVDAAQKALYKRAHLNGLAQKGEYKTEMEKA